jgi:hypothetical protein
LGGVTAVGNDLAKEALIQRRAAAQTRPGASAGSNRAAGAAPKASPTPLTTPTPSAVPSAAPDPAVTALAAPSPSPTLADYTSERVVGIGDSVMLGARSGLEKRLGNVAIDAEVSRALPGIQARVDQRNTWGVLGQAVVIHAGTNGPVTIDGLERLLDSLSDAEVVVLVTVRTPHWWMPDSNAAIHELVRRHPEVRLADWEKESSGHGGYFVSDGTHLTSSGITAYSKLIVKTLRGG